MDFVFWIIVIVLIVGVVWWLLNRSKTSKVSGGAPDRTEGGLSGGSSAASAEAAATTGIPGAAGFGKPAEPAAPTTADETPERSPARSEQAAGQERSAAPAAESTARANSASVAGAGHRESDQGEWETQWSEAGGSAPAATHRPEAVEHTATGATRVPEAARPEAGPSPAVERVHHPEYTGPHSPTLPGAETAAAEATADAGQPVPTTAPVAEADHRSQGPVGTHLPEHAAETETLDSARSSAAVETAANHTAPAAAEPEQEPVAGPAGHLAADEPYGAGSASPRPDGSGPEDFTVKGDAGAMVYYEEGHPDYEQTRAEVWFESPAHAEAAGFRAPRRKRL
jgi:hypothetical protein